MLFEKALPWTVTNIFSLSIALGNTPGLLGTDILSDHIFRLLHKVVLLCFLEYTYIINGNLDSAL